MLMGSSSRIREEPSEMLAAVWVRGKGGEARRGQAEARFPGASQKSQAAVPIAWTKAGDSREVGPEEGGRGGSVRR